MTVPQILVSWSEGASGKMYYNVDKVYEREFNFTADPYIKLPQSILRAD
jgi:hypothetical protein